MDRLSDPVVCAATAGVRDGRVDVGIGGIWTTLEQSKRAHDHARLAIAALRRVEFLPRDLHRMAAVSGDAFDSCDLLTLRRAGGETAGSHSLTIHVYSACTALPDAATELGSRQPNMIANDPEQGSLRIGVN